MIIIVSNFFQVGLIKSVESLFMADCIYGARPHEMKQLQNILFSLYMDTFD